MTCLQLVHLVRSLRAAGHFTAVAVTKPFEFEGQRKLEAAERLVAALEEAAHLVVVVEQVGCSSPACSLHLCSLGHLALCILLASRELVTWVLQSMTHPEHFRGWHDALFLGAWHMSICSN